MGPIRGRSVSSRSTLSPYAVRQLKIARGRAHVNPKTRLPRTGGKWVGEPGNGLWYSTKKSINKVTGGKPIRFVNGRPIFTPWAKGKITFKKGVLDGSKKDFKEVYKKLMVERGLPSQNAAKRYLRKAGLTPHHLNSRVIQFIPTALHKLPHIGSASDLRGGF